ncbi:hypothetical protein P153DRAFT_429552 [Dothidotthia symphoricarpi CBS 119687]|uniref:Uncharacterized protein n=1 Tax=Dothidotthia symphoricarpi CBS 119687 TaxID=1392245 RepID=A0A6A6APH6_9PLEO|nr:uncharacterized protein P153DRAFT_429552 [Dothidotthia symphoricarpi CBS 119687]KAF2132411.1 hypothetical protein P153DRAFT_429552 [Dothidotthia symphoricarpi CBS 119687]
MEWRGMSPYTGPNTPDSTTPVKDAPINEPGTPVSMKSLALDRTTFASTSTLHIPKDLTQTIVDADPKLRRLQQDLLVLTGFNDNETLHWRPSWFHQTPFSQQSWTLHNPPNVVTERLPSFQNGPQVFTRRMRRTTDPPPAYVRDWEHWYRVCDLYGIPHDFLCEEQVELMRFGLPRTKEGGLCRQFFHKGLTFSQMLTNIAPPMYPLYPEPQPKNQGRYILTPSSYKTHLPRRFHSVQFTPFVTDDGSEHPAEVVVVHSNGMLTVETREDFFYRSHPSQWTHFNGYGGYRNDDPYVCDMTAPKDQGKGRRWSYVPWTREQEESCRPATLKLKFWNEVLHDGDEEAKSVDLETK